MRYASLLIGAVTVIVLVSIACGGELPPPSSRDPVSPKAPQAAFDPGPNPFGSGLPPAPSMPSASAAPASSGPRR